MTFAKLSRADVDSSLQSATRQYLVGRLERKQALKHIDDPDIEMGISAYASHSIEPAHKHSLAKEYQLILKGMTEYMDLDTNEVHRFCEGDFYVIYPGTSYLQRVKRDTRILFVKYPAGNDKATVKASEAALSWASEPLRVERQDLKANAKAPPANSLKPAVAVAVQNDAGEILVVRRRDSGLWAMPGGVLEITESLEACARREVFEETGISIEVTGLIGTYTDPNNIVAYSDGEVRREFSILLVARAEDSNAIPATDDESTDVVWKDVTSLYELPMASSQRQRVDDVLTYLSDGRTHIR